ncbi:unnamed protein product [Cladocopium goreaui]|uniref:Uncharacterized protein n=1 Tax=Cladocopium goreaui TaxID=2562237 RepID=A0A9P1CXH5_9DINO|nr:unnamed protein product [Cladocopium goreaui]
MEIYSAFNDRIQNLWTLFWAEQGVMHELLRAQTERLDDYHEETDLDEPSDGEVPKPASSKKAEVVTPYAKIQLAAAKRAEAASKSKKEKKKDSVKGDTRKGKTKVKSAPKAKGRAKSAAKPKTKESKKQPAGQSKDNTTKTRSVTPYGEAKKAFTAKCREDDPKIRAKQIEILWKESKERKEIVAGLPESEQKRRRYI